MLCTKFLISLIGPFLLTLALALDHDASEPLETSASGPSVHTPISGIEQIEIGNYSLPEVLQRGEQIYWRSCVNCHGTRPEGVHPTDQQRFVEVVRSGSGAMPGLGYKLNAVEAEMVRWYLSECTRKERMC